MTQYSTAYVQARWAYSELPLREEYGRDVDDLRKKSAQGLSFESLSPDDVDLLTNKFGEVRGCYFCSYFDGVLAFHLVPWRRAQLEAAYVISWWAIKQGLGQCATFKQWAATEPFPACASPFIQKHPATVGQNAVLLD